MLLLQNFHFLQISCSRIFTPTNTCLQNKKKRGKFKRGICRSALQRDNPFSFAVPSFFQNRAAICLSTANIGIIFQSTKFSRKNFRRAALFPKFLLVSVFPFASSPLFLFSLPLTLSISHFIPLPHFSLFPLPPPNPLLLYCNIFLLLTYPLG